ncbi:hypothetical protein VP1G_09673 [Cytospora mali]|uniref:Uncharacterized protein n=1 Tax=Cytospora mali TaxID=578113 RepID=A0A194VEV8_CYTMA|nr:hypothetical protein VP1G_09673 [Valsa mali var. pyri (nom. inval.)]
MSLVLSHCERAVEHVAWNNIPAMANLTYYRAFRGPSNVMPNITCETIFVRSIPQQHTVPFDTSTVTPLVAFCFLVLILACLGPFWLAGWEQERCPGGGGGGGGGGGRGGGGGPKGSTGWETKSNSDIINSLNPLFFYTKNSRGAKRKDREDDEQPTEARSNKRQEMSHRRLACHFYLHDRRTHRDCRGYKLARIGDVRQHVIGRTHKQPRYCPVCGDVFIGARASTLCDTHVQARTCSAPISPIDPPPGVSDDKAQEIRNISETYRGAQISEVERWYLIWDVLFPGEERPPQPYLFHSPDDQLIVDLRDDIFSNNEWLGLRPESMAGMTLDQSRSELWWILDRVVDLAIRRTTLSDTEAGTSFGLQSPGSRGPVGSSNILSQPSGSIRPRGTPFQSDHAVFAIPSQVSRPLRNSQQGQPPSAAQYPPHNTMPYANDAPPNGPLAQQPSQQDPPNHQQGQQDLDWDPNIFSLDVQSGGNYGTDFSEDTSWVNDFLPPNAQQEDEY